MRPSVEWNIDSGAVFEWVMRGFEPTTSVEFHHSEDGTKVGTMRDALRAFRDALELDAMWFEVRDFHGAWSMEIGFRPPFRQMELRGALAQWKPAGNEARLSRILSRGVGAQGRIPAGLPATAYRGHEPEFAIILRRQSAAQRLKFFRNNTDDEVYVTDDAVSALIGDLGSGERIMGGREFRAWVEEAPDGLVDVQPGEEGQNLFPRREVLAMIWDNIKET